MRLTDQERQIIEASRAGKAIISNCIFGFMVRVSDEGGRAKIECPTTALTITGPAQAEHVRKVIASWSAALAAYDADNT